MTIDELVKALDERKAARRAQKGTATETVVKAKKKKKMPPFMEDKMSADEKAAKAASDPIFAAELQLKTAKAAVKAAKAGVDMTGITKSLEEIAKGLAVVKGQVEVIAAQPMPTPVLTSAGIAAAGGVAALRGAAGTDVFKGLEDKVQKALSSGDNQEYANANRELSTARMVAFERLRAGGVHPDEAKRRAMGVA